MKVVLVECLHRRVSSEYIIDVGEERERSILRICRFD